MTVVPPHVRQQFNDVEPYLGSLSKLVDSVLQPWCKARRYEYQTRVKELDSLAEKIETGRYPSWNDLDDLLACAIMIPSHSHEQAVVDFLDARFDRDDLKLRGSVSKSPETFRFDSTRWRGRVKRHPEGLRPEVDSLLFEVQVRTAFEHAWNLTTHDLVFKGDRIEWRRMRLVAQLKAAVEQIDMLIDGFPADLITESPWRETEQQSSLRECFLRKLDAGLIDSTLRPSNWSRFASNLLSLIFASAPSRRRRDEHFGTCLVALDNYNEPLPLSCSLLQSALGILVGAGLVTRLEDSYAPLVTRELEQFFPGTSALMRRFTF